MDNIQSVHKGLHLYTGETGKQKKSYQAPNTDVGQTMVASFARPLFRPRCR